MLDDLRAATGPDCGAHFAGWAFNDFPLDLADPERHVHRPRPRGSAERRRRHRFLMDRYFVFRPDAPTDEIERLAVILLIGAASTS